MSMPPLLTQIISCGILPPLHPARASAPRLLSPPLPLLPGEGAPSPRSGEGRGGGSASRGSPSRRRTRAEEPPGSFSLGPPASLPALRPAGSLTICPTKRGRALYGRGLPCQSRGRVLRRDPSLLPSWLIRYESDAEAAAALASGPRENALDPLVRTVT